MFVKICGITRAEDAALAVESGASAVGFIFWEGSARYIEPARARAIVRQLPPFVTPVGVFVNDPVDHVNAVAETVGLGVVQMHGDESPEMAVRANRPVLKALSRLDADTVDRWPDEVMLLVDADDRERRGGTGQRADWPAAAALAARRRIVLAGGLTSANVVEALRTVRPFGIDVSSGVEDAPGIKSAARMAALFDALKGVSADLTARQ
jgi:phosphoribosylanthranilate isomerase